MPEYLLPDVGEGLTEAEIVSWKVAVGDTVAINDVVVEIETAKSLVELPSPYAGVVGALLVAEGDTVPVGTPIIRVGEPTVVEAGQSLAPTVVEAGQSPDTSVVEEGRSPVPTVVEEGRSPAPTVVEEGRSPVSKPHLTIDLSNPAATGGGEGESLVGRNKAERSPLRRARRSAGTPASGVATRTLAKPPVRKLAKDLGVDLSTLIASGPNGSVTRADVEAAAPGTSYDVAAPATTSYDVRPGSAPGSAPGTRETREPIKGLRKAMGQAMVDSAFTAPHVTEWVTVDVTPTTELVARLKGRRELRDLKISPLLVLARAVCLAVRRTPEVNSWWDDAAQEVVLKHYVNLGIAAATPRGLVVPVIPDADALDLVALTEALSRLTETARAGRTQPSEMTGGTFTITNVGPFGIDSGTPIINPGESAILCFGAVRRQPWVVTTADGTESLEIRDVCTLALSFDHRHIDGEKGSRFLADVAGIMSDPGTALLF